MQPNMVSFKDYENINGFGSATQEQLEELNKALNVGQDINAPTAAAGEGFPLRVESLEATLKVTAYKMAHLSFYRNIPQLPAYNTVEEHNELSSYGENPDASWIAEGQLPNEDSSIFERKYSIVKFLGVTRKVSHVATTIKTAPGIGAAINIETINGTMHLLKMLERGLFYGDSSLSALQFDGFEKLMNDNCPSTNIIDMRGEPLSEDVLTDATLTASDAPNYGLITDAYMNPKVKADLVKTFYPKERQPTLNAGTGKVGLDVTGFVSPAGEVNFNSNVFITDGGAANAAAIGDATVIPGTPTITTAATSPADAASQFAADDAGDYYYKIVACNRYGKSARVAVGAGAVTVSAGDKVTFGVTPGGSTSVEWYELYRTQKNGAALTERLILRIPNTTGAAEFTVNDYNANLPYCTSVFLFQMNREALSFKQLAPMVKIPLAVVDLNIRWAQVLYGTPVLYAPGKVVLLKNVGRASGFVGAP